MTKEVWKDINGYGGLYQVSSLGRVKRVEKTVLQWNHQLQKKIPSVYPKKYLKFDFSKGYNRVTLSKNNTQERIQVHRLVAMHFIPNPDQKPCINHINHTRTDNRAENLEWVTYIENEHAKSINNNKPFKVIHPDGQESIWYAQMDCARSLGLSKTGIWHCLHGDQNHHRGYKFSYIRPLEK